MTQQAQEVDLDLKKRIERYFEDKKGRHETVAIFSQFLDIHTGWEPLGPVLIELMREGKLTIAYHDVGMAYFTFV